MDFVFNNQQGCPLGRITMIGESGHGQSPPIRGMRRLGRYALVYLYAGTGRYRDAKGRKRALHPGDCILLFPEIAHHYEPDTPREWGEFYIVFDGPIFDLWRRVGLVGDAEPVLALRPIAHWLARFRELYDARRAPSRESCVADLCKLQTLLGDILWSRKGAIMGSDERLWLEVACSMLSKEPSCRVNYENIARDLGVSYEVFRRRFRKLAGVSPNHYRQTRVIDQASRLLFITRKTLAEIAAELGFCDEFHFSKTFKKITGQSPTEFRREFLARA